MLELPFGTARSKRRVAICILAALLVVIGLSWSYAEYEAQRAKRLLAEAGRIRIGDNEVSIQPVLRQFGDGKCMPSETPEQHPKENWVDEAAYEHWLRTRPDCTYFVAVDPWDSPLSAEYQRFAESKVYVRAKLAMWAIPGRVRSLVGMRESNTSLNISVRGGHVTAVRAGVYVESRDHWLGHHWELLEEMPYDPYGRASVEYEADGAFLTFGFGSDSGSGETAIINHMTAKANEDEVQAAQSLNMSCLTRVSACKGMCDLSHSTIEYLRRHRDASRGYIVPNCQ
jgi:hypothetical protein